MKIETFGTLSSGESCSLITIRNQNGMTAVLTDVGASLVKLFVPDRDGNFRDVVLGYDDPHYYYRPRKNIVNRPVSRGGAGWHFVGDPQVTIPSLYERLIDGEK